MSVNIYADISFKLLYLVDSRQGREGPRHARCHPAATTPRNDRRLLGLPLPILLHSTRRFGPVINPPDQEDLVPKPCVALQIYTVRQEFDKDYVGTLKAIATMGYP